MYNQIAEAEFETKIPAHAQNDDLAIEMATIAQLVRASHLAHFRFSANSAASIADPSHAVCTRARNRADGGAFTPHHKWNPRCNDRSG